MTPALEWPRRGSCGACGRPAIEFPSRRWEHAGVPCKARSQWLWRIDDVPVKLALRFVPDGEPLPTGPETSHWHPSETDDDGIPVGLSWCRGGCVHSVREALAEEAERRGSTSC